MKTLNVGYKDMIKSRDFSRGFVKNCFITEKEWMCEI